MAKQNSCALARAHRSAMAGLLSIGLIVAWACAAAAQQADAPASGAENDTTLAGLEKRLERIEDQLVEMQSAVGALQTMVRSGPGANAGAPAADTSAGFAPSAGSGDLEIQIRALTGQVSELQHRLDRLDGGSATAPDQNSADTSTQNTAGFSSQTANAAPGDRAVAAPAQHSDANRQQPSSANAVASSEDAQALYAEGTDDLRRRDYPAAQQVFTAFLDQFPDDPLAPNAQFWLGEASFVTGDYRKAADLFLKAYTKAPDGQHALEALLKLGISLRRLGNNKAACDSFAQLESRMGTGPEAIARQLAREKRRADCG